MITYWKKTAAEYATLVSGSAVVTDGIYFITDTGQLYLNGTCYGTNFVLADYGASSWPASGASGTVYLNTYNQEMRIWQGGQWKTLVYPKTLSVDVNSTDVEYPTAHAVYSYVSQQIADISAQIGGKLYPAVYTIAEMQAIANPQDKALVLVETAASLFRYDAEGTDLAEEGVVVIPYANQGSCTVADASSTYDGANGTYAFDGTNYANSNYKFVYNSDTTKWDLTAIANDTVIASSETTTSVLPISGTYTGLTTCSVTFTAGTAGRWYKLITAANFVGGNGISIGPDGRTISVNILSNDFVFDSSGRLSLKDVVRTVSSATAGHVAQFTSSGGIEDLGNFVGSATLNVSASSTVQVKTLATEAAVITALSFQP